MDLKNFLNSLNDNLVEGYGNPHGDKPTAKNVKIDKSAVMDAATDAAESIFGRDKVDLKLVGDVVEDAIEKGKDTEDAVQIAINMMRSDYKKG
jgi:hypothetical protein